MILVLFCIIRYAVIDLSAGPCTYGKIETEEGSVSSRTLPRLRNVLFPRGFGAATDHSTHDNFLGELAALVSTTIEHVIAPDVRFSPFITFYVTYCTLVLLFTYCRRLETLKKNGGTWNRNCCVDWWTLSSHCFFLVFRFETVDMTTRLLIPIIVLQNHNRYNIMEKGHNYSINVEAIEAEVRHLHWIWYEVPRTMMLNVLFLWVKWIRNYSLKCYEIWTYSTFGFMIWYRTRTSSCKCFTLFQVKKMTHVGQEVVIIGGAHLLHHHEKLAIAVSKAMRSHSLQETKNDGRFHVHTKVYLDGAVLREVSVVFSSIQNLICCLRGIYIGQEFKLLCSLHGLVKWPPCNSI